MTRALVWIIIAGSFGLCLWEGHCYYSARAGAGVALRQLAVVRADSGEIASIRAAAPPESRWPRPAPGLATRVADVVSKSGLPPSAFQSLSPETESTVGISGLRKQAARVTLDGLTLPDLGRFLQEWRTAEPLWTVTSIDITPAAAKVAAKPGQVTDRPLRAVLGIETIFASNDGTR